MDLELRQRGKQPKIEIPSARALLVDIQIMNIFFGMAREIYGVRDAQLEFKFKFTPKQKIKRMYLSRSGLPG